MVSDPVIMNQRNEKIPSPREIEKEISEFLAKKFGGEVRVISPMTLPDEYFPDVAKEENVNDRKFHFDLKPRDLISYLDQYVVRQREAKSVLATKICTHFNRVKQEKNFPDTAADMVGRIKSNVLMIGPTGVGKTYMVKLIAKKIGVPFVKGDATKFSETGYVGGDVEDLIRDLVREADGDIELARHGIVYIDEIDKIASGRNIVGSDISRTGVQRALLKPMEETEVELKVPHDPISMMQEIERFRKTGQRDKRTVNTKNILFIMSGAFAELDDIISKRMRDRSIGFGARVTTSSEKQHADILRHVKSEDITEFGFESEFVGRLPVRAVFERLAENDLYKILKNPNNPVLLGKKLDFATYGIDIKFEDRLLRRLARHASEENTGARGLVSAVEKALLPFETTLPSEDICIFPATESMIRESEKALSIMMTKSREGQLRKMFERLVREEKAFIREYVESEKKMLAEKYGLTLTPSRIDTVADFYAENIMEIGTVIRKIKEYSDEIKKTELYFYKNHDINIVMEEDAIDFIIGKFVNSEFDFKTVYRGLATDFEHGLRLVREKTGRSRFFITKEALLSPEVFISRLIRENVPVSGNK